MEMAEIPKFELLLPSSKVLESEEKKMGNQRISLSSSTVVSDHHINAYQYIPDSIVIDMDSFSSTNAAQPLPNTRTTLQRSLSRKGSQRGVDRKVNGNATTIHDKDTVPTTSSPKAAMVGTCSTPEKVAAVVSTDHSVNPHVHHPITITANMSSTATTENRCITRRNSFRRASSWGIDPKRVLLFFATLSSIGTMLLIYFTLTISKQNADEYYGGDLKQ